MSTPMPPAPPRRRPRRTWAGPLLWIGGAFAVGLLVTLVLLMRTDGGDFFRAGGSAPAVAGPDDTEALPAPMSGREGASGMDLEPPPPDTTARQERPRVEEPPPPPEPVAPPPPGPVAAASPARPLPDQSPPPRYPMAALRRGEGGEVVVRAQIGPDGVPTSVSIVQGSGSRALDREAQQAVRRWRFEPARGPDGAPTVDTVQVPIRFTPP